MAKEMTRLQEIKIFGLVREDDLRWLISKVEQYEVGLNKLLTKNDWQSIEEVEEYIRGLK